jgi:hypothetical protein
MLLKRYDPTSLLEKNKIMQEFFDILESVKSVALQDEMLQLLSKKINTSYEIILSEFKKFLSNKKFRSYSKPLLSSTQLNPNAISKELLLVSLLYQEYGKSILPKGPKTDLLRETLTHSAQLSQHLLHAKTEKDLTEEEKIALDTHQLRREKHL